MKLISKTHSPSMGLIKDGEYKCRISKSDIGIYRYLVYIDQEENWIAFGMEENDSGYNDSGYYGTYFYTMEETRLKKINTILG